MNKEVNTKTILYSGEKEEKCDEQFMKNMAIARSKGQHEATEESFEAKDDAKKKIDAMGVSCFTLACAKNAFRVIKNKKTTVKIIEALESICKEIKEEDRMSKLETCAESKIEDASAKPEDWTKDLEDVNERMPGIDARHAKSEAEIKIKMITGSPEECSEVITSKKRDLATKSLKQVKSSVIDF